MKITSRSPKETLAVGKKIARYLGGGEIICLSGGLGAGKTVLAKGIAEGLGIKEGEILSPTFVLLRQHLSGRVPFFHFDLYRIAACDIAAIGYEEYFYGDGVCVIEWAERLGELAPKEFLKVSLAQPLRAGAGSSWMRKRILEFSWQGRRYAELVKKIL